MKQYLLTMFFSALCLYGHGQNTNRNYVKTRTFQTETGSTYLDAVDYYDGLGRPLQSVIKGGTPSRKDLVDMVEYDQAGRPGITWSTIPSATTSTDLVPFVTLRSYAWNFYADSAYSRTVYENSPLNRVLEEYGPGKDWYNQKKAFRTTYLTNNTSDTLICHRYEITNTIGVPHFIKKNSYPTGSLHVTRLEDEEGITIFEFRDSKGQLLLMRQHLRSFSVNPIPYDTYYIYDNKGNLMFVLPPNVLDAFYRDGVTHSEDNIHIKAYGYCYRYDHRNRCIYKKLPGMEPIYYRYDDADQLIFTQDGENRKKDEWQFSIPDAQGRSALTGLCKNVINSNFISGTVTARFNVAQTATKYYQITGVTLTSPTIMTANYYDHYDFISKESFTQLDYDSSISGYNTRYGDNTATGKYKHSGLLTGSMERIVDNTSTEQYRYNMFFYDYKGRLIQKGYTTLLPGQIERECMSYNFTDQLVGQYMITRVNGVQNLTQTFEYTYDHAGRLTKKTHGNSRVSQKAIFNYTYDEAGRKVSFNPGTTQYPSVHSYRYTYNSRGWQTGITGDHLIEKLEYAANGNIVKRTWKPWENLMTTEQQYTYEYDDLNRLVKAISNNGYDTEYSYWRQGNLLRMSRYVNLAIPGANKVQIDELTYHYNNSNQVVNITDNSGLMGTMYTPNDYIYFPRTHTQDDFAYDKNGSMTRMLGRGITDIQYNHFNLPTLIDIKNPRGEGRNLYTYSGNGEKLRVIKRWNPNYSRNPVVGTPPDPNSMTSSTTTDYIGNKLYENGNLTRMMMDEGYFDTSSNEYVFHIKDYQGNTRTNLAPTRKISSLDYYPFGVIYGNYYHVHEPYKYNGKEFDHSNLLNLYDYGARMYDPGMAMFTTIDPLAEKYYHISPYAYCANDPVNHIDPDGRDIWIHYQDNNGKEQRIAYTAGMNYNGNNEFVSKSISYLNAINSYGGSKMIGGLINSPNSFNIRNQLPVDKNGNSMSGTLQFKEFASGGGNIYAGDLMTSGHYANIENLSHELFHGIQHENGQGGSSIYNEVEAYVYSGIVSLNWMIETGNWGGSANGQGFDNSSGKAYSDVFKSLLNHYSTQNFNKAVDNFKGGAVKNNSGLYNNIPLRRNNQKKSMLEKYYPQ